MQTASSETSLKCHPEQTTSSKTSFKLALVLSLIAFAVSFAEVMQSKVGLSILFNPTSLPVLVRHPGALSEFAAMAFGASTALPILHVALFSLFKSKRNPSTRRRIFIGWSLFIIAVQGFTLLVVAPKLAT